MISEAEYRAAVLEHTPAQLQALAAMGLAAADNWEAEAERHHGGLASAARRVAEAMRPWAQHLEAIAAGPQPDQRAYELHLAVEAALARYDALAAAWCRPPAGRA